MPRLGPLRTRYPTDPLGMPLLLRDRLASEWPVRVACRGYQKIGPALEGATYVFYTDDWRFNAAWSKPDVYVDAFRAAGLAAVAEPDFSVYAGDPYPEQLHAIYRTRWVGRHWQEAGMLVIPSLAWTDDPGSVAWTLAGIPHTPPLVAIESRAKAVTTEGWRNGFRAAVEWLRPERVLLYGVRPKQLPPGPEYRFAKPWSPRYRQDGTAGKVAV